MTILVITRGNEERHISKILDRLKENHEVIIRHAKEQPRSRLFNVAQSVEDFQFYKKIPQSDYYKMRINPKWYGEFSFLQKFKTYKKIELPFNYDIVICSTLFLLPTYEDYDIVCNAKELGIPVIGFVPTWDTPTTKCKIQVMPDLLFCWNKAHKQDLIKYHQVPEERIKVVGAYTFEKWLDIKPTSNTRKPYIAYLCSSPSTLGVEQEKQCIADVKNALPQYNLVVCQHPDQPFMGEIESDQSRFNTYYYAKACYGIATSAMFEAMLAGIPVYPVHAVPEKQQLAHHYKQIIPLLGASGYKNIREWLGICKTTPSSLVAQIIDSWYNKINAL